MAEQVKDDTLGAKIGRRLGFKKEIITQDIFNSLKSKLKEAIKVKPQALTLKNKKKVIRIVMDIEKIDIGDGVVALIDNFTVNLKSKEKYQLFIDFRPENGEWLKGYESENDEEKQSVEVEESVQETQQTQEGQ